MHTFLTSQDDFSQRKMKELMSIDTEMASWILQCVSLRLMAGSLRAGKWLLYVPKHDSFYPIILTFLSIFPLLPKNNVIKIFFKE